MLEWNTKNCIRLFKDDINVRFVAILIKLAFSFLESGTLSKFSCLCSALALPWPGCIALHKTAVKSDVGDFLHPKLL